MFTLEEAPYTAGEDFYRVEAIEEFTHQIMDCFQLGEIPETIRIHRLAAGAIEKSRVA